MYKEYFGLKENPFSIAPDPRYFFMSKGHSEALAHLVYGINTDGGFILLTGEVGTGKTTVCRCLLDHLPENSEVAFILNPKLTVEELLATICDEFGIKYPEGNTSNKVFISAINYYLFNAYEEGKRAILIIEEAQLLSIDVLEQIRLLTNLETNQRKLLQIVLLGQPELRRLLVKPQLRQLNQRITVRYHLAPLLREEIAAYVNHRLSVAGLVRGQLFAKKPLAELYRLTGGIPRLINIICDRALIGTFVQGKDCVDNKTLLTATREVSGINSHWWSRGISRLIDIIHDSALIGFLQGKIRVDHETKTASSRKVSDKDGYQRFQKVILPALVIVFFIFILVFLASMYMYDTGKQLAVPAPVANTVPQEQQVNTTVSPAPAATLEKPADITGADTKNMAYRALFNQWQLTINPKDRRNPCDQAIEKGLQCMNDKGSLNDLRQMNKPAVLKLVDENNHTYYAALLSLKDDIATFAIGKETRTVDIREIYSRWVADYTLFWKAPHQYKIKLDPGSRGPLVTWLDQQLSVVQGRAVRTEDRQVFDDMMIKEVREFQMSAGLVPDGIVGARTLICLANAAGIGGPTLNEKKGDK
jgi:general secretion pathway protein A